MPLVMIVLGGYIYIDLKNAGKVYWSPLIKFIICKNIFFPLVMLVILFVIRPSFSVALILLIESAAPPLSTVPILIQREGGNMKIANQYIVSSFIASIATIPVMVALLGLMY
jgi:predicted permease